MSILYVLLLEMPNFDHSLAPDLPVTKAFNFSLIELLELCQLHTNDLTYPDPIKLPLVVVVVAVVVQAVV